MGGGKDVYSFARVAPLQFKTDVPTLLGLRSLEDAENTKALADILPDLVPPQLQKDEEVFFDTQICGAAWCTCNSHNCHTGYPKLTQLFWGIPQGGKRKRRRTAKARVQLPQEQDRMEQHALCHHYRYYRIPFCTIVPPVNSTMSTFK